MKQDVWGVRVYRAVRMNSRVCMDIFLAAIACRKLQNQMSECNLFQKLFKRLYKTCTRPRAQTHIVTH